MTFKEELDSLTKTMIEVSDTDRLNVEWYYDLAEWKNCIWSWVNKRQPYEVKENVLAMKASVLE